MAVTDFVACSCRRPRTQIVECVQNAPKVRVSERIGEQISDKPMPQILKEIVELVRLTSATVDLRAIVDVPDLQNRNGFGSAQWSRCRRPRTTVRERNCAGDRVRFPRARLGEYHRTDCRCAISSEFGRDRRAGEVDECNGRPSSDRRRAYSTDYDDSCRGNRTALRERTSERICEQIVACLVRIKNKLRESVFFLGRDESALCADTARGEFLFCNMPSCGVVVEFLLS